MQRILPINLYLYFEQSYNMEKNNKKDLEQLLIKQTEKILHEIDPATSVIFSKNIKSHCKDLAKKFLKTQKKFQKQMEAIAQNETDLKKVDPKKETPTVIPKSNTPLKKVSTQNKKVNSAESNSVTPKKAVQKRVRKGNNLMNAAAVQKKAKAQLAKNIIKSAKK